MPQTAAWLQAPLISGLGLHASVMKPLGLSFEYRATCMVQGTEFPTPAWAEKRFLTPLTLSRSFYTSAPSAAVGPSSCRANCYYYILLMIFIIPTNRNICCMQEIYYNLYTRWFIRRFVRSLQACIHRKDNRVNNNIHTCKVKMRSAYFQPSFDRIGQAGSYLYIRIGI